MNHPGSKKAIREALEKELAGDVIVLDKGTALIFVIYRTERAFTPAEVVAIAREYVCVGFRVMSFDLEQLINADAKLEKEKREHRLTLLCVFALMAIMLIGEWLRG